MFGSDFTGVMISAGQQLGAAARKQARRAPPLQGYVLEWRRRSYRWVALVVVTVLDEDGQGGR